MTFEVPEGVKLYYQFAQTGGAAPQAAPAEETPTWTRYDGNPIPVNGLSGTLEYYAESHGLKSEPVTKNLTVSTGVSLLETGFGTDVTPVYFDLNGNRVNASDLQRGIYIKKSGVKVEKVII